jgi:hypothetical protein
MATRQKGSGRANALKRELRIHLVEASTAPAEAIYDLLADVRTHHEWGGTMKATKNSRLLSIEAPEGPASAGTEFTSTGADPMGRFADSSVVTEASRPSLFEFVTDARLSTRKGQVVEWTDIHRYELTPQGAGCRISYTDVANRFSDLPGAMALFKVPGLRWIGLKISGSYARGGLRNLARMAEERAASR